MRGKPVRRGLVATAAGWCAALALAAGAAAAPAWLPAQNVRDPVRNPSAGVITNVQLAGDPAGNTIAVWERLDPRGDADAANDVILIESAFRPAGGSFGSPQVISGNELTSPPRSAVSPDVGMDALGRALVVWAYDKGANEVIQARVRNSDGTFGAISDLSALEPGNDAARPSVAVNGGGQAAVVWERLLPDQIYGTTGSIGAGFAPAAAVSATSDDVAGATVAIDGAGNALFAWERELHAPTTRSLVEARPKPVSGAFEPVALLSPDQAHERAELPRVALDPAGRATVVWSFHDADPDGNGDPGDDTDDTQVIRFATRTASPSFADGSFSAGSTIPAAENTSNVSPDVVVDAENTAVVVWRGAIGGDEVVQSASRPSGGGFGSAQTLSDPEVIPFGVRVTMGPTGDAMAAWHGSLGESRVVQAARRPAGAGSSFGAVDEDVDLVVPPQGSTAGLDSWGVELAGDDQGNVIGTWGVFTCSVAFCQYSARFAAFDAAPPTFASVEVPGAAVAGQPVAMSASVRDRIGGATVGWGFGDGGGATGASASHVFSAPGAYNVTVTATDAAGNAAGQTRTIQVSSPPPVGLIPEAPAGPSRVRSPIRLAWKATRRHTSLTRFLVQKVPSGGRVRVTCRRGRGCPFAGRSFSPRRGQVDLTRRFRERRLRPGTAIEVRVTAPGLIGKVLRIRVRRRSAPSRTALCLPPGMARPQRSC